MNSKLVQYYQNRVKQGYRPGVIVSEIAERCSVSIHTVRKWLNGTQEVRVIYNMQIESLIDWYKQRHSNQ